PPSPPGLPLVRGRETQLAMPDEARFHGTPSDLIIGRNHQNSRANDTGLASTLAEPAAANDGVHIFYTGTTHAEFSTDGGVTWTDVPISGGPPDAPIPCCDLDVIYDQARGVTFWSVFYTNFLTTNGVIRIFVRRTVPGGNDCSYDIDPAGAANNILPDFPHLGISNNHLYLTTNNLTFGISWDGAQVRRFSLDQLADCAPNVMVTTFSYKGTVGQRVFVPVEGARETMYWGMLENSTTFRIFKWPQTASAPTSVTRTISASTFTNPDCRGGVGNRDWTDDLWARISGFNRRGAVGGGRIAFFWNVGPDPAHPQGHVHGAIFRESDFKLLTQPSLFNDNTCIGLPMVSANERGDLGISIAAGGKAGGGGSAAQGFVGLDDDFTPGIGNFGTLVMIADGTHNRDDERHGDYFTIHPHEPCDLYFVATNYALKDGDSVANVNERYVEFGRGRDSKCYFGWRDQIRSP
ncbi:MAG: hypothetical protein HY347_06905, partial [candidate division NC10 bacterium]|nr:hypothetical protein [candidate division NC10 bacterium]